MGNADTKTTAVEVCKSDARIDTVGYGIRVGDGEALEADRNYHSVGFQVGGAGSIYVVTK